MRRYDLIGKAIVGFIILAYGAMGVFIEFKMASAHAGMAQWSVYCVVYVIILLGFVRPKLRTVIDAINNRDD